MSNGPMLAQYLEVGHKMRLWVARGHPEKAAELFNQLPAELQEFRSFRKVKQAVAEDSQGLHGRLEKLFDISRLMELTAYRQPWKRRTREAKFGIR
jgi:hypothetical protein